MDFCVGHPVTLSRTVPAHDEYFDGEYASTATIPFLCEELLANAPPIIPNGSPNCGKTTAGIIVAVTAARLSNSGKLMESLTVQPISQPILQNRILYFSNIKISGWLFNRA